MKKGIIIKLILFMLPFTSFGGMMSVNGIYQGKNLFIENKFLDDFSHHCVTNIYVNSKHLVDHPQETIVEVDLSSFTIGDTLKIRIYHKASCVPSIINKNVIEPNTHHFHYSSVSITESQIHWETKGEERSGKFMVEQEINGQWKTIKFLRAKGTLSVNTYYTPGHHLTGTNKYRLKYRSSTGNVVYSDDILFVSSKVPVVFYPKRVVDFITFESDDDRKVEYAVFSKNGEKILSGEGIMIDCRGLVIGEYYTLRFENKEERFYKKEGGEDLTH